MLEIVTYASAQNRIQTSVSTKRPIDKPSTGSVAIAWKNSMYTTENKQPRPKQTVPRVGPKQRARVVKKPLEFDHNEK